MGVSTQGGLPNNALQLALSKRDVLATRMLMEINASISLDEGFETAPQGTAAQGNHDLASTTLEKAADPNASGKIYGATPALQFENLLERGAEVIAYEGIYGVVLQSAAHNCNWNVSTS